MERLGPAAALPASWCYRVKLLLWVEEPEGGLHHFSAWPFRRGSSPQRTDSLPQLLVSLVTSVGRCPMPLRDVGGRARPFLAEPLSGDSPSFRAQRREWCQRGRLQDVAGRPGAVLQGRQADCAEVAGALSFPRPCTAAHRRTTGGLRGFLWDTQ